MEVSKLLIIANKTLQILLNIQCEIQHTQTPCAQASRQTVQKKVQRQGTWQVTSCTVMDSAS